MALSVKCYWALTPLNEGFIVLYLGSLEPDYRSYYVPPINSSTTLFCHIDRKYLEIIITQIFFPVISLGLWAGIFARTRIERDQVIDILSNYAMYDGMLR